MVKQWRCRYCNHRNVANEGNCGECGRPFIPNLQQLLMGGGSSPSAPAQVSYPNSHQWWYGNSRSPPVRRGWYSQPPQYLPPAPPLVERSSWRKSRVAKTKAQKDAEYAASFDANAMSEDGQSGTHVLLGAARHHQRQAQLLAFCPEAQSALQEKSKALFQQAMNARPLAEQVAILEKELHAKVVQSKSLTDQLDTLQKELDIVDSQGLELEQKLKSAKVRLAAQSQSPPVVQEPTIPPHLVAIGQVEEMSSMLSPEAAAPFSACLGLLRQFLEAQQVPLVPPGLSVRAANVSPSARMGGVGQNVVQPCPPTPVMDLSGLASPSRELGPSLAVVSARRARARERQTSIGSNQDESEDVEFVPVRSRSAPGVRLKSKMDSDSANQLEGAKRMATTQAREEFLASGSRYFSRRAERAGLDEG